MLAAVLAGFGFYNSRSSGTENDGKVVSAGNLAPLTLSEKFYDFGRISMADGNVARTIILSNNTSGDIFLKNMTTSCMCTVAYLLSREGAGSSKLGPFGMPGHGGPARAANELIRSGESRQVEVVFDPNAHGPAGLGTIERAVYFEDSSGNVAEFRFKGLVTP